MRLTDLDPHWLKHDGRPDVGIRFRCPCCKDMWLQVLFLNPMDGGSSVADDDDIQANNSGNRWARSGMSFDDMTLSPSIDASDVGHWHGWLVDGEIRGNL